MPRKYHSAQLSILEGRNVRFENMVDIGAVTEICQQYTDMTGFVTAILELDGTVLVATGWRDMCTKYHRMNEKTLVRCTESDIFLGGNLRQGETYTIYTCKNGLADAAIPIRVRGVHVANFFTGQFFLEHKRPDEAYFRRQAKEVGIEDVEGYIRAYHQIPVITEKEARQSLSFLVGVVELIGNISRNEDELRTTLNAIEDAVVVVNTGGRVTRMNPGAERLCGCSFAQAEGCLIGDVFRVLDEATQEPLMIPAMDRLKAGVLVGEKRAGVLLPKEGASRWVEITSALLRERGEGVGFVLVYRDVTQERKAEEAVLRAKKLESVGVLAGGIAHDFNNILAAVLGNAELALDLVPPGGDVHLLLNDIRACSIRARSLTQQLLTFSRGGHPVIQRSDIRQTLQEVARLVLSGSTVACRHDIPEDLWPVDVDLGQIGQAVRNIVLNAREAMPKGGEIHIVCTNIPDGSAHNGLLGETPYVRVAITDQGPGIPPEMLECVFDPFFSTKAVGSGLGLAVCHSIVHKHGGLLTVTSEPGQGACLTLYLPASPQERKMPPLEDERTRHRESRRILVMDDEAMVRTLMKRMLEKMGHIVETAVNGEDAIARYKAGLKGSGTIDLILMDLTVANGMGGRQAAAKILDMDPAARMVVVSGYASDVTISSCQEFGFCASLAKPFDYVLLREVVDRALGETPPSDGGGGDRAAQGAESGRGEGANERNDEC